MKAAGEVAGAILMIFIINIAVVVVKSILNRNADRDLKKSVQELYQKIVLNPGGYQAQYALKRWNEDILYLLCGLIAQEDFKNLKEPEIRITLKSILGFLSQATKHDMNNSFVCTIIKSCFKIGRTIYKEDERDAMFSFGAFNQGIKDYLNSEEEKEEWENISELFINKDSEGNTVWQIALVNYGLLMLRRKDNEEIKQELHTKAVEEMIEKHKRY